MKRLILTCLLLAISLPSNGQTSQAEKIQSAGKAEGRNENSSLNSSLPAVKVTDQEVANERGLTLDQVRELRIGFRLSNQEIAQIPQTKLEPLLWRLRHPTVDLHAEALKFRRLKLQDEKGEIPTNAWLNAAAQKKQMAINPKAWPASHSTNSSAPSHSGPFLPQVAGIQSSGWTWLGPGNIGGRVRSILIHPTTPSIMWVGGVDGGVWKTTTSGASWFPLDDFMANLAISCMVMDPADPNVIYAGTGEGYGNGDTIQGAGIFKTTDGGANWAQLFSTISASFNYVNRLAINPTNSQIILAATGSGIYRSTDGGASWSQRYSTGTFDLAFDPSNGSKCIASGYSFVVSSTNVGVTWISATGISGAGRIEIAYAPSSPSTVYASADKNFGELYRSTDGGHTYTLRNTGANYFGSPTSPSQGWYDNCLWVDPTDPNNFVVGGLDLWRSTDAGTTLTDIGGYSGGVHPDQHVIVPYPSFGSHIKTVYVGNDGGIFATDDIETASGSSGWSSLNNNLGITQFYGAAGNATSGTIVGGTQDNGTVRYTTAGGTEGWTTMFGGDGGFCAADPTDTHYFYGEYVTLRICRSTDSGTSASYINGGIGDSGSGSDNDDDPEDASALFIAPFILDPNNQNTMLAGGSNLWRSVNVKAATPTWSNIKAGISSGSFISAIVVAPGNSDIIWVGYEGGEIYETANGTAANPAWTRKDTGTPSLPNRYCTRIAIDPNNANQVYVTFAGFSSGNVWRTTDGGTTWTDISHNLPYAPANSLVIDPYVSSYLYVGTEVGVFASADGGANWSPSNDGPANVAVDELSWVGDTLLAATHGRGCFSIQPITWVQYGLSDPGNGTYARPYNTLARGTNAVQTGGTILFKYPGSTPERPRLAKPMTIGAVGGPATIGQ